MDWISETFRSDVGWSHLESLVDVGSRMAGSDGERRGLELTRDALESAGAREARIEEFDIQGWARGTSQIVAGDTIRDCIALPRSPSGTARGRFVDVGHGLPEDFEDADLEGSVVMADSTVPGWYDRSLHRREKYYHAVERGAAAFVFRNHVEGCLPPTGSVGRDDAPIGEIPAVGVSKEVGSRLARRFDGEEVTVEVEADVHDATSGIVRASVGPETDERLLLTSHVDAHDISEGAMDNGAGTATVVEIVNALTAREAELDTRVAIACFGAEEVGLKGSEHLAETTDRESIRAVVNLDGVCRSRTLSVTTHHVDALAAATRRVRDRFDHPISIDPTMVPHSDHWPFVARGVPGLMVASESGADRGWGHTAADTLEKLEKRDLRESAILLTELVVELADSDESIPHIDGEDVAEYLRAEGYAEGMRRTGDWPF
ncbi:M28 family peptidase [Halapricum salinum]|uniref:Carboxypeptidase Q n=1 Tax=Halapricum salinum TaxID=1457250 RepID=A0A4D6H7T2_9EURY|nr:M28 family peptidase [Halapricum salinum]QCC49859.1 peptidase M28 [Halapricum salinum]